MIDIAPPKDDFPKRIPPRELIKQKIAESEIGGLEPQEKPKSIPLTRPESRPQPLPSPPSQKKGGIGVILVFIFVFLLIFGLFAAVGLLFFQSTSFNSKIQELNKAVQTGPKDFETQKTKLETLEKDLADLKKAEAEKIKNLEDKINKIPATVIDKADKKSVEQLEMILKATDTDKDGLFDFEEVVIYKSNPNIKDSDGDGYSDKVEVDNGYNPNGAGKLTKESATTEIEEEKTTSQVEGAIQVKTSQYKFDPSQIEISYGEKVKLQVVSLDSEHTFTVDELNVNQTILPGESEIIEFTPAKTGEYTYYSNIVEDKAKGMAGKLIVK